MNIKLTDPQKRHIKIGKDMPEFGLPFLGQVNECKLMVQDIIPVISSCLPKSIRRFSSTCFLRSQKITSTIEVLKDLNGEESVQMGEFLRLLHQLTPREQKLYKKVAEELEAEIGKSKQVKAPDSNPTTELTGTSCQPLALQPCDEKIITICANLPVYVCDSK